MATNILNKGSKPCFPSNYDPITAFYYANAFSNDSISTSYVDCLSGYTFSIILEQCMICGVCGQ